MKKLTPPPLQVFILLIPLLLSSCFEGQVNEHPQVEPKYDFSEKPITSSSVNFGHVKTIANYHTDGLLFWAHYPDFFKVNTIEKLSLFFNNYTKIKLSKEPDNFLSNLSIEKTNLQSAKNLEELMFYLQENFSNQINTKAIEFINSYKYKKELDLNSILHASDISSNDKLLLSIFLSVYQSSYDFWSTVDFREISQRKEQNTLQDCLDELSNCIRGRLTFLALLDAIAAMVAVANGAPPIATINFALQVSASGAIKCLDEFVDCYNAIGDQCEDCPPGANFDGANCYWGPRRHFLQTQPLFFGI